MKETSIAIIGVGAVGATIAYTLLVKNRASSIILVDTNTERCQGEVADLVDCIGFSRTAKVYVGTYEDAKKADIVIISAGRPQKPGEPRSILLDTNKEILHSIMQQFKGIRSDALIIIVANPLDTLTYYAHRWSELPRSQIFGTGTFLDAQRLKHLLSSFTQIGVHSIESFILGEHGDSQVVAWSHTRIAGNPVQDYGVTKNMQQELAQAVKSEAYEIIKAKSATFYGIAACVAELCEMIIFDSKQVVPLSWYHASYDVCMSMPVVLGRQGIEKIIPCPLTDEETKALEQSAAVLRSRIKPL